MNEGNAYSSATRRAVRHRGAVAARRCAVVVSAMWLSAARSGGTGPPNRPANEHRRTLNGKRILLLEDNALHWVVIQGWLEDAGACVTHVKTGSDARMKLEDKREGFDGAVLDIRIDDGDTETDPNAVGLEIVALACGLELPFVVATAMMSKAGFLVRAQEYEDIKKPETITVLQKPLDKDEFINAVCEVMGGV